MESAGRILMLVENPFPADTRIRNECDVLTRAGYQVSVIAIRMKGEKSVDTVNGVHVYRIPELVLFKKTPHQNYGVWKRALLKIRSLVGYVGEYAYFTLACFLTSLRVAVRHGFDTVHAHNPPDMLFLIGIFYKLFGKKFIFDHHDLSAELYMSRYGLARNMVTQTLLFLERCSLKTANVVIATNESYKEIEAKRGGVPPERIFVVRNGPNADRMELPPPSPRLRAMNKCILCYIGSLNPQDGVDYLLRSLHHLINQLQRRDFYCVIMGSGDSLGDLRELATELKLNDHVELTGFVSEQELRSNLAAADICMDPDPSSPLNDVSTWIKIMEYMAAGKPIVSFDLKETRFSAQAAAVFVPPNDERAFAEATAGLMDDPEQRARMGKFARARVENELQWSVVGKNLLTAYRFLSS